VLYTNKWFSSTWRRVGCRRIAKQCCVMLLAAWLGFMPGPNTSRCTKAHVCCMKKGGAKYFWLVYFAFIWISHESMERC
jgi:hypothetical protein